jgi:arylformamidase
MISSRTLLTRRTVLRQFTLAAGASAAGPLAAIAGQAEREPAVWLDMSQQELNDAYNQSIYAPNIRQVVARYDSDSARARRLLGDPRMFAYGTGRNETLDVFATGQPNAPIHLFIHGGAWQQGKARTYAFPAPMFVDAGVHYVVPDFDWIQDVGDSLYPIADQVRRAIAWVYRNAGQFGGDPERLFISGHSSGGHLAGVMLTTDWRGELDLPADVIKGGLCCSGMFDMEPVRLSARGDYVAFTDEMEHDMSPMRHIDRLQAPVIVAYGDYETPEFQRQSRDFASAVNAAGKPVELLVAENYNHLEIIETLANPYGILGSAALAQIQQFG